MMTAAFSPFLRRWPLLGLDTLFVFLLAVLAIVLPATNPAGAQDDYEPDPQLVANVWDYARETDKGFDHVQRWRRVLHTLGVLADVSAAEAQGYADQGWARWEPVAAELTELESAPDAYEPDQQLIANVRVYAAEDGKGFEHVRRWTRVLHTLGVLEHMSASEAQGYADRGWEKWEPVAAELAEKEAAAAEPTPDPTATPEESAPGAPSNLTVSATAGELDLSATWDALDGAASYQLAWRQADGDFEANNAATVSDTETTITVSAYGQWVVRLEGCNDTGCGPSVTQTIGILPGAPANLAVSATAGELDLSATWDALDGAASYQLSWRPADGDFEAGNAATVSDTSAAITVSGYGQWVVRLEGCNDAGCGPAVTQQVAVEPPPDTGELRVSIAASPAYPQPGEVVKLRAVIANAPAGAGPKYQWELDVGGDNWLSLGKAATASYAHGGAGTSAFRVTVSYDGGDTATSTMAVEWTETPPNRAPVVHQKAWRYSHFVGKNNAPRGVFVSKIFNDIFSDPDGDELTYTASVSDDQSGLVVDLGVSLELTDDKLDYLYIRVDGDGDWKAGHSGAGRPADHTGDADGDGPGGPVGLAGRQLLHRLGESSRAGERRGRPRGRRADLRPGGGGEPGSYARTVHGERGERGRFRRDRRGERRVGSGEGGDAGVVVGVGGGADGHPGLCPR